MKALKKYEFPLDIRKQETFTGTVYYEFTSKGIGYCVSKYLYIPHSKRLLYSNGILICNLETLEEAMEYIYYDYKRIKKNESTKEI
jgi:hypothetical protein